MSPDLTAMTPTLRLSRKNLVAVLLSIGYAFFVVLFPWGKISRGGFPDFDNYVYDFNYLIPQDVSVTEFYNFSSPIEYFTREVLWFELIRSLTGITGEASIALNISSLIILFIWGLFLFRRVSHGMAFLFLFNPIAIDVAMSGIRNALAWALVIIGLNTRTKTVKAALFLTGMFMHSTVLALAIFYYFTKLVCRYAKGKTLLLAGLGVGIFIGLALTIGGEFVLGAIGDRRLGENYAIGRGSLLQASLWGILLYFQCKSSLTYIKQNIFIIAVLAWYLTMNLFIPWSFRIWGAFLPVIAASAMSLSACKRQLFIFLYSGYLLLQYLYWTKIFDYWYLT